MPPQRRPDPKNHLDASLVPLENALLHRADELDRQVQDAKTLDKASMLTWLSAEFRALAEELHHW